MVARRLRAPFSAILKSKLRVLYKEKNNRILVLLFFLISINVRLFGQEQQVDKIMTPPLPRNGVDTMILKQSSDAIKTWLEICILEDHKIGAEIYERDKCEEELIKNFILENLQVDISEESGKVTLEYVIEKEREIGWIRVKEDTTRGKIGKLLKASFEKIKCIRPADPILHPLKSWQIFGQK